MPGFTEVDFRRHARRSNEEPIPRNLSLYVHVPYCFSPCFYCGCNRIITRDYGRAAPYTERVMRETERVAALFDRSRELVQVHFGGGTPNFLRADLIERMLTGFGRHFHFSSRADRDFSIELDPRTVRDGEIAAYAAMGFNRASLGVQDFDRTVQLAINREQSVEQTLGVIDDCRRHGFRSVNVDLIYGLPKQNRPGFGNTLDVVLRARPDRVAIYGYAHMPQVFKAQKQIVEADLPDAARRVELLSLAIEKLTAAGIPAGPVQTVGEALEHPQSRAMDMVVDAATPDGGSMPMLGLPLHFDGGNRAAVTAAPRFGADTVAVLRASGFSEAEIERLVEDAFLQRLDVQGHIGQLGHERNCRMPPRRCPEAPWVPPRRPLA